MTCELPDLPQPTLYDDFNDVDCYSAEQMRAYGLECARVAEATPSNQRHHSLPTKAERQERAMYADKQQVLGEGRASVASQVDRQIVGLAGAVGQECASRQSAKVVLRDRINYLRREAERLEALCKALPEELPPLADQALWDMAIGRR